MCNTWCRPSATMVWSNGSDEMVRIANSARLRTLPVSALFNGSQKTTLLVSLETFCRIFVHNTQWPSSTIGMKIKSRSATFPRMACPFVVYWSTCTHSGSTMVKCSVTSGGSEYSINNVNKVIVQVDAISPSLHMVSRSDSVTSTAISRRWQVNWYLNA